MMLIYTKVDGKKYVYGNPNINKSLRKKNLSSKYINRIGVSINPLDCLHKVKKLCEYLGSLQRNSITTTPKNKKIVSNIKYLKKYLSATH